MAEANDTQSTAGGGAAAEGARADQPAAGASSKGQRAGDLLLIVLEHTFTNVAVAGLALRFHPEGFLQGTYTCGSVVEPLLLRADKRVSFAQAALGSQFPFGRRVFALAAVAEGPGLPSHFASTPPNASTSGSANARPTEAYAPQL